eukprot:gene9954-biopygen11053
MVGRSRFEDRSRARLQPDDVVRRPQRCRDRSHAACRADLKTATALGRIQADVYPPPPRPAPWEEVRQRGPRRGPQAEVHHVDELLQRLDEGAALPEPCGDRVAVLADRRPVAGLQVLDRVHPAGEEEAGEERGEGVALHQSCQWRQRHQQWLWATGASCRH